MRIKKHVVAVIATVAALVGLATSTWVGAAANSGLTSAGAPATAGVGVGETLLLVVGGVVPPSEALTRLETINERFGEFQGLYVDSTSAYDVTGALLQTSPDLVAAPCVDLDGDVLFDGCPAGEIVRTLAPITMTLVDVDALDRTETKALCSLSGDSCGLPRITQMLGDDFRLDTDAAILATGFRTKRGAQDFLEGARAAGVTGLVTLQAKKLSGGDIGLGQEPAPDGSGPLMGPLDDQERYQR